MNDPQNIESPAGFPVRLHPEPRPWVHLAGFAILAIVIGLGTWTRLYRTSMFVALAAIGVLVKFTCHPHRCPQCQAHMLSRRIEEYPGRLRRYWDCWVCRITWKSQSVVELRD